MPDTPPSQPTVFISYSHDDEQHKARVRRLADRLNHEGIQCELDQYHYDLDQRWSQWSRDQIARSCFVLVVCTEIYCRRAELGEDPGKGLGATWEAQIIQEDLFNRQGKNEKFLPVRFDPSDKRFIPGFLNGFTYYDLSSPSGYDRLCRRITGQPEVIRPPLGSVRPRPPLGEQEEAAILNTPSDAPPAPLSAPQYPPDRNGGSGSAESSERLATRFLAQFDHPVPVGIIERALHGVVQEPLAEVLTRCGRAGQLLRLDAGWVVPEDVRAQWRLVTGPPLFDRMRAVAQAYIQHIDVHSRDHETLDQQHENIMRTLEWCANNRCLDELLKFIEYEKHLKWRGRKKELLFLGDKVIEAGKFYQPRHPNWVTTNIARAYVCGRAWIYQRVGRVDEAISAATYAKELDDGIDNRRGAAFDSKCLGNAHRLKGNHEMAERLLNEAVEKFSALGSEYHIEVGDCKTLLARVFLDGKNLATARVVAQAAEEILQHYLGTKDWQDWQLLMGDLNHGIPTVAEAHYQAVISSVSDDAVQRGCEQYAAAHLGLGKLLARPHRDRSRATTHLRIAAKQYGKLDELEHAAEANWLAIRCEVETAGDARTRANLQGLEAASSGENCRVRVAAWTRHVEDRGRAVPAGRRASRETSRDSGYWRAKITQARADVAAHPELWPWGDRPEVSDRAPQCAL